MESVPLQQLLILTPNLSTQMTASYSLSWGALFFLDTPSPPTFTETSHFCPRFAAGDQLKKYVFITVIVDLFHTKYVLTIFMFLR